MAIDSVMQIITGRERRRRWSVKDKLRIVGELAEPGARACDVAARHSVCESLVFTWRRQLHGMRHSPDAYACPAYPSGEHPGWAQAAAAVLLDGLRQFQGRRSASRLTGWSAILRSTSASQARGSTSFSLAVTMRL